jgi:transcriptional regulator with XRE-family HTH domain
MERLKELRKARGLSQTKLAQRADMSPATLNRVERGLVNPSLRTLERLAEALGVEVRELLDEADYPKAQAPLPFNGGEEERRGPTLEDLKDEFQPLRDALDRYTSRWERRLGEGNVGHEALQLFLEDLRDIHEFFMFAVGSELWALADAMDLVGDHPYHRLPEDAAVGFTQANLLEASMIHPALLRFYKVGLEVAKEAGAEEAADQMRSWHDALSAAT